MQNGPGRPHGGNHLEKQDVLEHLRHKKQKVAHRNTFSVLERAPYVRA